MELFKINGKGGEITYVNPNYVTSVEVKPDVNGKSWCVVINMDKSACDKNFHIITCKSENELNTVLDSFQKCFNPDVNF